MRPCVKQSPQHIPTNIYLEGGLGRSPSKHRTRRIENDQARYLCIKHRTSARK
jgi:hypothetical protein